MEFHPIANLLPLHDQPGLVDSIKQCGLLEEIVVYDGQILDGRQRFLACQAGNIEPRFRFYDGEAGNPVAFVKAKNIDRRHLTTLEKAQGSAALLKYWREQLANQGKKKSTTGQGKASEKAAKVFRTSTKTVERMDKIQRKGVRELQAPGVLETLGLKEAARIASLPPDEQLEELASQDSEEEQADLDEEKADDFRFFRRLHRKLREGYEKRPTVAKVRKKALALIDQLDALLKG